MVWLLLGGYIESLMILYCWIAVVLCSLLIFTDLVVIMKDLETEEYILAAMMLYVDIIRLLIYLIMIFGESD